MRSTTGNSNIHRTNEQKQRATSTSYGFRPRGTLKRARWNLSDSETSSDSGSDLSSDSSSDQNASSDDDDSTAATSDVDYDVGTKSDSDDQLSDTESMRALDALDSDDEEWGFTPTRSGARRRTYRARRRHDGQSAYRTPRKRRAVDANDGTPSSVAVTPKDKLRILGTVSHAPTALPARPRTLSSLSEEELNKMSNRQRAKRLLHVGATPESLPCREEQFEEVAACLEDAVQEGLGGCVYVSGVPGTGKTATVREVIRSLQNRQAQDGDKTIKPFNFVEINGMKLQDAHDAYSVLWHALTGVRCSNANALYRLSRHFGTRLHTKKTRERYLQAVRKRKRAAGDGVSDDDDDNDDQQRATTVVLLDELDQMVTTRQDVMYNFFNWPNGPNSRLVVVAVANTMDLPERVLHAKVASRLGMTRITFKPYSDRQLCQIVHARLGIEKQEQEETTEAVIPAHLRGCQQVFAPESLVYLAKRISNVSGDARRMLDVCRRAIDAAEEGMDSGEAAITIGDMKRVLDAMVKSGKGAHITHLPTQAKVALVAVLLCVRRAGTAEVDLATVTTVHTSLCRMHNIALPSLLGQASSGDQGGLSSMSHLLSRLCSTGLIIAVGSAIVSAKSGKYARYILACSEDEARLALEQDHDERLRSLL